jgi:hypothetical protein
VQQQARQPDRGAAKEDHARPQALVTAGQVKPSTRAPRPPPAPRPAGGLIEQTRALAPTLLPASHHSHLCQLEPAGDVEVVKPQHVAHHALLAHDAGHALEGDHVLCGADQGSVGVAAGGGGGGGRRLRW